MRVVKSCVLAVYWAALVAVCVSLSGCILAAVGAAGAGGGYYVADNYDVDVSKKKEEPNKKSS
jgi:hypothetical protein